MSKTPKIPVPIKLASAEPASTGPVQSKRVPSKRVSAERAATGLVATGRVATGRVSGPADPTLSPPAAAPLSPPLSPEAEAEEQRLAQRPHRRGSGPADSTLSPTLAPTLSPTLASPPPTPAAGAEERRLALRAHRTELARLRRQRERERQPPKSPLTPLQQRFVSEYLALGVGTEAARRAGYSDITSKTIASRLLRRPQIAQAVAEGRDAAQRRSEVTMDRVIGELAKLAFADPRDLFTAEGKLKPIHLLDDASAASIAALEVLVLAGGPRSAAGRAAKAAQAESTRAGSVEGASAEGAADLGAGGGDLPLELRKIKRWDKTKALELLGRYLGLFKDRLEVGVSQDLAGAIEAARRRVQGAGAQGAGALGAAVPPVIDVDVAETDNTAVIPSPLVGEG